MPPPTAKRRQLQLHLRHRHDRHRPGLHGRQSQNVNVPYAGQPGAQYLYRFRLGQGHLRREILGTRSGGSTLYDYSIGATQVTADIGSGSGWLTTTAAYAATFATGTWYQTTYVITTNSYLIYVNGVLVTTGATAGVPLFMNSSAALHLGHSGNASEYWDGSIDEVRLSSNLRSADWIKLEYETQKAAATTVTMGARPADFTNSVRFNFNTTSTGANITGLGCRQYPHPGAAHFRQLRLLQDHGHGHRHPIRG